MSSPVSNKTPGFIQRHRYALGAVVAVAALVIAFVFFPKKTADEHKEPEMTVVDIPPPPPPPPQVPPPPQPPPPEEKMVEQTPVKQDTLDAKPDDSLKATDAAPDGFGLTGTLNGTGTGGGGGRWGWYAASVQAAIKDALYKNDKTRHAALGVKIRIWPDRSGRVIRAELASSTGDPAVDDAIKNEVLDGLQLSQPPPDMPDPIVLRLSRR